MLLSQGTHGILAMQMAQGKHSEVEVLRTIHLPLEGCLVATTWIKWSKRSGYSHLYRSKATDIRIIAHLGLLVPIP
jgi:hypothetical protein